MTGTVIEDNEICCGHRSGIETAGGFSDLIIRNNDIHNFSGLPGDDPDALKYGNSILMIRGSGDKTDCNGLGPVNITIENNEIYNCEKNAIYTGPINQHVNITENNLHDNGWDGIRVDLIGNYWNPDFDPNPGPYTCLGGSTNVNAHYNNIYNNGNGTQVIGTPTNGFILDAECNWWGDDSGPQHASNPYSTGGTVSDNMDFIPWLDAPYPDGTCVGEPGIGVDDDWNYWSNSPHMYNINDGNVGINTDDPQAQLDVNGSLRVQGSTQQYLFFVNAATEHIGIGTNVPEHYLHVVGTQSEMIKISGSNYPQYVMESSKAGAHEWSFFGADTGWFLRDITNKANPFGVLNDTPHQSLVLYPTVLEVNHKANDYDFRVKSTGNSYMLFVDASENTIGIGTNNPSSTLDVAGDIEIGSSNAFYFGDPETDGTWRIIRNGSNLEFQLRESGGWTTKDSITP